MKKIGSNKRLLFLCIVIFVSTLVVACSGEMTSPNDVRGDQTEETMNDDDIANKDDEFQRSGDTDTAELNNENKYEDGDKETSNEEEKQNGTNKDNDKKKESSKSDDKSETVSSQSSSHAGKEKTLLYEGDWQSFNHNSLHSSHRVPDEVMNWAQSNGNQSFSSHKVVGNETYILVARGESSSTGYGVQWMSHSIENDQLIVHVKYTNPQPSESYATMLTYPMLLVKIDGAYKNVDINIENKSVSPSKPSRDR